MLLHIGNSVQPPAEADQRGNGRNTSRTPVQQRQRRSAQALARCGSSRPLAMLRNPGPTGWRPRRRLAPDPSPGQGQAAPAHDSCSPAPRHTAAGRRGRSTQARLGGGACRLASYSTFWLAQPVGRCPESPARPRTPPRRPRPSRLDAQATRQGGDAGAVGLAAPERGQLAEQQVEAVAGPSV
jgi:hypothetical protein